MVNKHQNTASATSFDIRNSSDNEDEIHDNDHEASLKLARAAQQQCLRTREEVLETTKKPDTLVREGETVLELVEHAKAAGRR